MQLYIAMNLCVPHYQVPGTMSKQYLLCLQDFVSKNSDKEVIMYRNTVGFHCNNFVTVINDINFCPELKELSKHFNHTQAMYLIQKFKEHGKEDGNRNNVFFDRGKSCGQNQVRTINSLGIAVPRDRITVTLMKNDEKYFCDQSEIILYMAMKKCLPTMAEGLEHKLYNVPESNKAILQDQPSLIHASHLPTPTRRMFLNIHIDSQNPTVKHIY